MNLLEEIILYKRIEIAERKKDWSVDSLRESEWFSQPGHSLKTVLLEGRSAGIIAEFKRKSPSRGDINTSADVTTVTKDYTKYGAAALSVLTDEKFFGGLMPDLLKARPNDIPILRKDFIIDKYQVTAAKSFGADVILLIAACLTKTEVADLARFARETGLETILEIHNEEELGHICEEIDIVGINNRNLKTFDVDINTSLQLIDRLPKGIPAIAESGIRDIPTLLKLKDAGFKGFLIGEQFMKQADPGKAFKEFVALLPTNNKTSK
jgi:indole-3-glycerol phosphate synthase